MLKMLRITFVFACLAIGLGWSTAASAPPPPGAGGNGSLIRLQFATFDPLVDEPVPPKSLRLIGYPDGESGPYIVQFQGPVQTAWKDALREAGVQIDSYLPDYAYIVRMDEETRVQLQSLGFVRWVGMYQPAYKVSPNVAANTTGLYRVHVASWADLDAVRGSLVALDTGVGDRGSALVIHAWSDQIAQIAQLPDVLWIEAFHFFETYNDKATGIMNATTSWTQGYTGIGQTVTIADSGLDTGVDNPGINDDMHRDLDNRVAHISSWPVVADPGGLITNPTDDDGPADVDSGHGTHVTGSVGGNGVRSGGLTKGPAYGATMTFQAVEQFTTWTVASGTSNGYYLTGIPNDLNNLFQESYGWGARIHTNSWGSAAAGEYDETSQQADQFAWSNKGFTILFAAGNEGVDGNGDGYVDEDSMGAPATAKNVISIGASENLRNTGGYNPGGSCSTYYGCWGSDYSTDPTRSDRLSNNAGHLAAFSSRGPTDDGRIKPDLVAPGTNILSIRSSQASGTGWGTPPNAYYMYMGGTSMATPLAAGAAVVVRDYLVSGEAHANPSSALIKATLINSAVDISGYGVASQEAGQPIPNNHEGWGRIDMAAATNGTDRVFVDDPSRTLTTNLAHTFPFTATNSTIPLKVSLVWTDYPGTPAASRQLVNNLDLVVTAPDGSTTHYGNNFSGGWSSAGGVGDQLNNVENVYVQSPTTGVWTIDVVGSNVPQGPQPYALVVSGKGTLGAPTTGPAPSVPQGAGVYLPIVLARAASEMTNGDFESGRTGWTEYSTHGWVLIKNAGFPGSVAPRSGNWAVWLGGEYDDISYIEQEVAVSSASPYLAYWHWIASAELCGFYDIGGVIINGNTVVDRFDLCTSANTGGWVKRVVNLSVYAGQTVRLQIRAETDYSNNSNLFIDDVAFQATSAASEQAVPTVFDPESTAPKPGAIGSWKGDKEKGTNPAPEADPMHLLGP